MIQFCRSAPFGKSEGNQLQNRQAKGDGRRHERGVRQRALDDDFDVAEPVPDNRGREGERHEAEGNRRQLQGQRRIDAERPGERVAERKRTDAERGAPRDPAKLTPRGDRRHLLEAPHENDECGGRAEKQIHRFKTIERFDHGGEQRRRSTTGG